MKLTSRYFVRRNTAGKRSWTPPSSFAEFLERYPKMISTMGRNALSKLQQGKFHASDQPDDLVHDLYDRLMDGRKIRKFNINRHPRTPENGFKAYIWLIVTSLTKNWVKEQNYFHIPIDDTTAHPGCLPEQCLPASTVENPYEALEKREIATAAEAKVLRFMEFISTHGDSCKLTIKAIEMMSLGDCSTLSDVQKELGLSDQDRMTLKVKLQELWHVFTVHDQDLVETYRR